MCHGNNGEGNTIGPELLHPVEGYATHIIRTGKGAMPAYTSLTDANLAEIFAFLQSAPRPTTAEGLFNDFCKNCHGAGGTGGAGKAPTAKGKPEAEINAIVRAGHGGMDYGSAEYMPAWTTAELSDAELQLIVGFLQ